MNIVLEADCAYVLGLCLVEVFVGVGSGHGEAAEYGFLMSKKNGQPSDRRV